jgi:hypothetical protein
MEVKPLSERELTESLSKELSPSEIEDTKVATTSEILHVLQHLSPQNNYTSSFARSILNSQISTTEGDWSVLHFVRTLIQSSRTIESFQEGEENGTLQLDANSSERLTLIRASNSTFIGGLLIVIEKLSNPKSVDGHSIVEILQKAAQTARGDLDIVASRKNMLLMQALTRTLESQKAQSSEAALRLVMTENLQNISLYEVADINNEGVLTFHSVQREGKETLLSVQPDKVVATVQNHPSVQTAYPRADVVRVGDTADSYDIAYIGETESLFTPTELHRGTLTPNGEVTSDKNLDNLGRNFQFLGKTYEISSRGNNRVEKISKGVIALRCELKPGLNDLFSKTIDKEYILIIDISRSLPEVRMVIANQLNNGRPYHDLASDGQRLYASSYNHLHVFDLKTGSLISDFHLSGARPLVVGMPIKTHLETTALRPPEVQQQTLMYVSNFELRDMEVQDGRLRLIGTNYNHQPTSYTINGNLLFPFRH